MPDAGQCRRRRWACRQKPVGRVAEYQKIGDKQGVRRGAPIKLLGHGNEGQIERGCCSEPLRQSMASPGRGPAQDVPFCALAHRRRAGLQSPPRRLRRQGGRWLSIRVSPSSDWLSEGQRGNQRRAESKSAGLNKATIDSAFSVKGPRRLCCMPPPFEGTPLRWRCSVAGPLPGLRRSGWRTP